MSNRGRATELLLWVCLTAPLLYLALDRGPGICDMPAPGGYTDCVSTETTVTCVTQLDGEGK